jgi:hypothetical protein
MVLLEVAVVAAITFLVASWPRNMSTTHAHSNSWNKNYKHARMYGVDPIVLNKLREEIHGAELDVPKLTGDVAAYYADLREAAENIPLPPTAPIAVNK